MKIHLVGAKFFHADVPNKYLYGTKCKPPGHEHKYWAIRS